MLHSTAAFGLLDGCAPSLLRPIALFFVVAAARGVWVALAVFIRSILAADDGQRRLCTDVLHLE
jgi:hypothetical protein